MELILKNTIMRRRERYQMEEKFRESGISSDEYHMAFKRMKRIKGFYVHLLVYILVNAFFIFNQCFESESLAPLTNLKTYSTLFFWGIGLAAHGFSVFGRELFFGNDWEERKIKEFMQREK